MSSRRGQKTTVAEPAFPYQLLEMLDERFRLLRGSKRGAPERQQTLEATVTWSYDLLGPDRRPRFT